MIETLKYRSCKVCERLKNQPLTIPICIKFGKQTLNCLVYFLSGQNKESYTKVLKTKELKLYTSNT